MNLDGAYPRRSATPKKRPQTLEAIFLSLLFVFIYVALTVPTVCSRCSGNSKDASAKSDIATLCGLVNQFKLDCGRYPTTKEGLQALKQRPPGMYGWHGPYLKLPIPLDPWGNAYRYDCPGPNGGGFQVESYGADGQPGGTGDNADIIDGSNQ